MSEHEERARKHGWVPKEDFRGDPDKWRTAEEFNDIGDNLMPVMKERLQTLEDKHTETLEKLGKATDGIQKLADHHRGTQRRARDHAIKTVRAEMRQAAADGDVDAYDRLTQQEGSIAAENPAPGTPPISPEYAAFAEANPWYEADPVLKQYADQLSEHVGGQVANDKEFYKEIRSRVAAAYPTHKAFAEETAEAGHFVPVAPVEGGGLGGDGGAASGEKKTWKDLPKEYQDTYELEFSDMSEFFSREDYAKGIFEEEE